MDRIAGECAVSHKILGVAVCFIQFLLEQNFAGRVIRVLAVLCVLEVININLYKNDPTNKKNPLRSSAAVSDVLPGIIQL